MKYSEKVKEPKKDREEKKKRRRNVIWYSPPFHEQMKTSIGRQFLKLIDKRFWEKKERTICRTPIPRNSPIPRKLEFTENWRGNLFRRFLVTSPIPLKKNYEESARYLIRRFLVIWNEVNKSWDTQNQSKSEQEKHAEEKPGNSRKFVSKKKHTCNKICCSRGP